MDRLMLLPCSSAKATAGVPGRPCFHCSFWKVTKVVLKLVKIGAVASNLNKALVARCVQARQVAGECQNCTWPKNTFIGYAKFAGSLNTSPSIKNDP